MESYTGKVKTNEFKAGWDLTFTKPTSLDEAKDAYGEDGALYLLNAGLKVKQQAVGRDVMAAGGTVEDANQKMAEYRPGGGARVSNRVRAFDLIALNSSKIMTDADLKAKIRQLMAKSDFKGIVEALGEKPEDEGEGNEE